MRLLRPRAGWLTCFVALALTAGVHAEMPDPLRFIPPDVDLLLEVPQPQRLVDAVQKLAYVRQLDSLEAYREFLDSTNVRRFYQLLAYFEKELGCPRAELLDRLAGGGVTLGLKFGPNPAPAIVVIQGRDEELARKFFKLGVDIIEQDLTRQESKNKVERSTDHGSDVARIGKDLIAARVGSTLLLSNPRLPFSLQPADGKNIGSSAQVARAHHILPHDALASLWINFGKLHQMTKAEELLKLPRNDPQLTVLFGGWLDIARRAPFLCAGLYEDGAGFRTMVRLPAGRDGMAPGLGVHVPPADQAGSLPLLEPKGVLYSTSYYLDLGKIWEDRTKLFPAMQVKALEEADKKSAIVLAGNRLNQFLGQAGPHQRVVVAHNVGSNYHTVPGQRIPAFAVVVEMREPEKFRPTLEAVLRSAALLATTQFGLKQTEEKIGTHTLVSYRFPEGATTFNDPNNIRYNFTPCFVVVGNQFVASSTVELGRELVGLIEKEGTANTGSPAAVRSQLYATGGADLLAALDDQLFAQTYLDQAFAPEMAQQQVQAFIDLVRGLGVLRTGALYGANEFRFDIEWQPSK